MSIISEFVGGIILLLIFANGVKSVIEFFATKGKQNGEHNDESTSDTGSKSD